MYTVNIFDYKYRRTSTEFYNILNRVFSYKNVKGIPTWTNVADGPL